MVVGAVRGFSVAIAARGGGFPAWACWSLKLINVE